MKEREPSYTVGGDVSWCSHCGKQDGIPQETKNRIVIYISGQNFWMYQKDTSTLVFIAALFKISKTWMDKDNVIHIYNGILLSNEKEQNNAICRNMDAIRESHIK